jgi:hypothetical protein
MLYASVQPKSQAVPIRVAIHNHKDKVVGADYVDGGARLVAGNGMVAEVIVNVDRARKSVLGTGRFYERRKNSGDQRCQLVSLYGQRFSVVNVPISSNESGFWRAGLESALPRVQICLSIDKNAYAKTRSYFYYSAFQLITALGCVHRQKSTVSSK